MPGMTRTTEQLTTDGRDADLLAQQARARAFSLTYHQELTGPTLDQLETAHHHSHEER